MRSSRSIKCLSILLSCVLVVGLSPMTALAIQDAAGGSRLQTGNLAQMADEASSGKATDDPKTPLEELAEAQAAYDALVVQAAEQ